MPIRVVMNPALSPSPCTDGALRMTDDRTPRSASALVPRVRASAGRFVRRSDVVRCVVIRVAVQRLAVRAMQVARSVGRASRRGAKGGVRVDDPKQLLCIRPAIETFADEPPSLVLLVHNGVSVPLGSEEHTSG